MDFRNDSDLSRHCLIYLLNTLLKRRGVHAHMAGYEFSTQVRYWTFTPEELAKRRQDRYDRAQERVSAAPAAASSDVPSAGTKRQRAELSHGLPPLTLAEEQQLLTFYEHEISRICAKAGFDRAIMATATVLFKRFYIDASPTEFPPASIVHTAIFAAIKVEACPHTELQDLTHKLLLTGARIVCACASCTQCACSLLRSMGLSLLLSQVQLLVVTPDTRYSSSSGMRRCVSHAP